MEVTGAGSRGATTVSSPAPRGAGEDRTGSGRSARRRRAPARRAGHTRHRSDA